LYVHFNTRKEASLKNRRILVESVLVCLVLLIVTACTPTPPENIYWEPDGSGFIRFRTDDPLNADQGFVKLYDTTLEDTMTTPVKVTVKKILGSVRGGFGVVFCALNDQNYLSVLIDVGGQYCIRKVRAGGASGINVWGPSDQLQHGYNTENTIKITRSVVGVFDIYIDDVWQTNFSDSDFSGGKSGFFAGVGPASDEYEKGWVDVRFKMVTPVAIP
jgi:hypothetical protein